MTQEYRIGREYPGTIEISERHSCVSRFHAKILIDDQNHWTLVDNGSSHGTFVVEKDGSLRQVSTVAIQPTTVIQLGPDNVHGFQFTAGYINDPSSGWDRVQEDLQEYKALESRFQSRKLSFGWASKLSAGVAILLAMFLSWGFEIANPTTNTLLRLGLVIFTPIAVGLVVDRLLDKDREELRSRGRLRCPNPKCRRPLSHEDIEYGECPYCKSFKSLRYRR